VRIEPIIPAVQREPFDDPQWLFELKWDGFRGIADTVNGRMLSKNKNHFRKFDRLLRMLPPGCVFDGEIVALDADGRPIFNNLLFGRGDPMYVAFDILVVNGRDMRSEPLKARKSLLKKILGKATLQSDYIIGASGSLFSCVQRFDLEGIVAKRMSDPYAPPTKWFKILNRDYSQKIDRAELFNKR
jgi:bifunctional non-homologous end joining protein LigD